MLTSQRYRDPPPGMPLVLALFSFRYDAHLVPDLVANLTPIVHGHIAWDDRAADAALSSEPARRNALLAEAHRQGAVWLLACDPDERFEDRLADRMPRLLAQGDDILWSFSCREMFSPTHWRADGLWGGKKMIRLFPASAAPAAEDAPLHGGWVRDPGRFRQRDAQAAFYHLRMAHPRRRRLRRDLYAAADPGRLHQAIGYDYLDDDRGLRLEPIAPGHGFSPPFVEDGGLWAPDPGDIGTPAPDPFEARLSFLRAARRTRGSARAAFHTLTDLAAASPADTDLRHAAARAALWSGLPDAALATAEELLQAAPGDLHAHLVRAEAAGRTGAEATASESLRVLEGAFGASPLLRQLRARCLPRSVDLAAPDALWRRWLRGAAQLQEGPGVPEHAALAAIVIGLRAQPGLAGAVASLLDQDTAAEVVVVNTGGGDCAGALSAFLPRIRLINVEEPLFVGAARNIGIDASRAPLVAFLAADCTAEPGWVSGRLARHRAGAAMVSTPVLPASGSGPLALAAHFLTYGVRHPMVPPRDSSHFGRSYARWVLDACGAFPPGLRIAEDDRMHRLADRLVLPDWAPDVAVRHPALGDLRLLLRDERARGGRRADHPPYRSAAGNPDGWRVIDAASHTRLSGGAEALSVLSGLTGRGLARAHAAQWLLLQADRAGLREALERLAKADTLWQRAEALRPTDPAGALPLAEAALAADGQDWRKPHLVARLLRALGRDGADAMASRAADLAPHRPEPVLVRAAWAEKDCGPAAAMQVVEAALCRAPGVGALWLKAAALSDSVDRARACLRAALCLSPDSDAVNDRLAAAHQRAGDARQAAFRQLTAQRIRAWAEARKVPAPEA